MSKTIIIAILIVLIINIPCFNYKYQKFYNQVANDIELEGVVTSNLAEKEYYNSYIVKGKNDIYKNKKFLLYTKNKIEFGDKIKIKGLFLEPEEQRNFKGFNYKRYLQTQGIYGSIKSKNIELIKKNDVNILLILSNRLRNSIINNIKIILPNNTEGLLEGILLGYKENLDEDISSSFQKSSLSHILAVSGTHVSYIILALTFLISISRMSKKCGYLLIILSLIVFLFLTNFTISVLRACVMASILIISKLVYRKLNITNSLGIALLITLIINPLSIQSVSLQLSYLGTIGVIYLSPILNKAFEKLYISKKICNVLSVPISAQVFITPIIIKTFHTISFTFLLSNIIAIPLLGVIMVLGCITVFISFISLCLAQKIGIVLDIFLKILIHIANICANFKLSNIYVITPSNFTILIYYILLLTVIYIFNLKNKQYLYSFEKMIQEKIFNKRAKKILIIVIITLIVVEIPYTNFNGNLKIYFLDVGQRR